MVRIPDAKLTPDYQIGDYVAKAGIYTRPGVVVAKTEEGTLSIDTDPTKIAEFHRHTNTTGLTPEEKERFNSIMDEIMSNEENSERINRLQEAIDTLAQEQGNAKVVQTLRNEQAQLIRYSRELPRVYQFPSKDIVR